MSDRLIEMGAGVCLPPAPDFELGGAAITIQIKRRKLVIRFSFWRQTVTATPAVSSAVQPFHFGGGSDEGSIVRLRRAIDNEGCARQRLERSTYDPVGVEIACPGRASAQDEEVLTRPAGQRQT